MEKMLQIPTNRTMIWVQHQKDSKEVYTEFGKVEETDSGLQVIDNKEYKPDGVKPEDIDFYQYLSLKDTFSFRVFEDRFELVDKENNTNHFRILVTTEGKSFELQKNSNEILLDKKGHVDYIPGIESNTMSLDKYSIGFSGIIDIMAGKTLKYIIRAEYDANTHDMYPNFVVKLTPNYDMDNYDVFISNEKNVQYRVNTEKESIPKGATMVLDVVKDV